MTVRRPHRLALACGGAFLGFLDATVTNLAVPSLLTDFDVSVTDVSWVVTIYAILFAALLAPGGALADFLGRERLFRLGIGTFTVASLGAALAPTFGLLVAFRAVQGAGAALLIPASLAFVLADIAPHRRPAAIGLWSASAAVAAAIGPTLGGMVVEVGSWRWLFVLNLPVGLWLYLAGRRLEQSPRHAGRLPDLLGGAAFVAAIGLLVLAIAQGEDWGWSSPAVVASAAGAAIAGAVALVRSTRHPHPAVQVGLWRSRVYASANATSLLFGAALYITLLVGVLFLVDVWRYSTLEAGLAVTPGAITAAAVGIVVGRLPRQPTPATLVAAGSAVLTGVAVTIAVAIDTDPNFLGLWLPTGLALGIGIGAVSVGVSTAAAMSAPPQQFAAATGLNIAARQVGGAVGVAILAAILAASAQEASIDAYRSVYWLTACLSLATIATGLLLRPRPVVAPVPVAAEAGAEGSLS